ncbi:hypothetical protein [Gymnodinialimonas ulvae]|uniref:hypothetical protein n=1 Tax=Gymnodinialimonas ulvae TaxID=3126504 RepID=UPI0030A32EFA
MASILTTIRTAAHKRAAYNRIVSEISALPPELAVEDLGIFPEDAQKIAYRSVYGK